ncbi:hypothetical protein ABZP36_036221 [Zizania latifolia]
MDHTERRLMCHAVFATVVGHRPASSVAHVKHRFTEYLRIQPSNVEVFSHLGGSFLVFFTRAEDRSIALAESRPPLRGLELKLIPWSWQVQASFAKMRFRARLCVEGIPHHAWNSDTTAILLSKGCLIDKVDNDSHSEKEATCLCVCVWTQDANKIPKSAYLHVVEREDISSPPRNFPELGITEPPSQRGPPGALLYNILIHHDQLWDFSPPKASGEPVFNYSSYSAISGLDSPVSFEDDIPRKSSFLWELGALDGSV